MGYTTDFTGKFTLDKRLNKAQAAYLRRFAGSRRMRRNALIAATFPDPLRIAVGLPIGVEGEFYVGTDKADKQLFKPDDPRYDPRCSTKEQLRWNGFAGQRYDPSIINYNNEPCTQPGLWCQWVPSKGAKGIEWNGGEKFYYYQEWLQYLITNFLTPWDLKLSGSVNWQGEDDSDTGTITVANNTIITLSPRIEEKFDINKEGF